MRNNPNYKVTNYMANRKIYAAAVLLKKLIFRTMPPCGYLVGRRY